MGGKGRKRREKNYRAAHGGTNVLPPPPDPSKVDALPSKLRQIISFTSSQPDIKQQTKQQKKHEGDNAQSLKDKVQVKPRDADAKLHALNHKDSSDEQFKKSSTNKKNKKKRKRKELKDLRFEVEEVEKTKSQIKRHERKKKYFEAKKKHKKNTTEEEQGFAGHEKIKFGEIVEAPPKLNVIPRAFKNLQDASQERFRLQAIEQYRSRKGWVSRPGSHLPPPVTTTSTL